MTKKDMKITEHFGLSKTQAEVDFIDIYVWKDVPLFLDPWAIRQWNDDFSILCHSIISSFFEKVIEYIISWNRDGALNLLAGLSEPSETHLWFAKWTSWSGIWKNKAIDIYEKLKDSEAVQTWFLNDLEDTALMIEWIKEDNISDIVTNLIRFQLIKYTQEQCIMHWIPMRTNTPTWHYWNNESSDWETSREDMLIVEWKPVILVPKLFARKTLAINFDDFYNFDVLEFEQSLNLDAWTSLCRTLKSWEKRKPSKKTIKKYHPENKKQYIYDFSKKHPKVLEDFKKRKADLHTSLSNHAIDEDLDLESVVANLISELKSTKQWKPDAYKYEKVVLSILELIFYPELYKPNLQYKINWGRKIIDISYENTAGKWFFLDLVKAKIACRKIYFECKNYKNDIWNPEVDQLNGRFDNRISEIGFLVYREIEDIDKFNQRVEHFIKQWHFIIWLSDDDLITLLNYKLAGESYKIDKFLNWKLNNLL